MPKSFEYYYEEIEWRARGKPDFSTLFAKPEVFTNLIKDLTAPFRRDTIDKVVSPESMGYIIGSAAAQKLKVGFVPVRKGGKLPTLKKYIVRTSFVDYSRQKNTFEMNESLINKGDRVLLIDDWVETGGQAKALIKLLERRGAEIVGVSCLGFNLVKRTQSIADNYRVNTIFEYTMEGERDLNAPLA